VTVAAADVRRAEAAVGRAEAQLALLGEDASDAQRESARADLRLAQAELDVARAALEQAQLHFSQSELRAPFAGTVASVAVAVGEQVAAGAPIVAFADVSGWFIETTDLSELDVVRIAVGDRASVAFDALPDVQAQAVVERIQVRGTADDRSARFVVVLRPLEHVSRLRWGMSATVTFDR
jgi:HlyD family secretion protein